MIKELSDGARLVELGDAAPVLSLSFQEKRYGVISEVLVRDKALGLFETVYNDPFIRQGGSCRRVVNTSTRNTYKSMSYSGRYQIEQSEKDRILVSITVPCAFTAFPGDLIQIKNTALGIFDTMQVREAENILDTGGERCILTLGAAS